MYNIVIVEDEHIESEALRRIISRCVENSVIHEAATGKKAIQLIDQLNRIDMMFVDINIPLPNGSQVIQYLRRNNNDTKVIVTTANDDFDIVRSMLNLNVDDYLLKPVKQSTLTATIKKTLNHSDDDNAISREMKQKTAALIDACSYRQWHDYLFDTLNGKQSATPGEQNKVFSDFLEVLNQYLAGKEEKISALGKKVDNVLHEVALHGLTSHSYYRIMLAMLSISEEIFDYSFKHLSANMDFVERAKFHIEKNILKNITLDDIATHAFVSSCYLSRAFKKATGTGFSNYIANRKMAIAKSLLRFSDLKVNTIALELSYQDANYFCRIFKKETDMAPSDYRKACLPAPHAVGGQACHAC